MNKLSKVISLGAYKKKRKRSHWIRVGFSVAKILSIASIAFILIWTFLDVDHRLVKGFVDAKAGQMEYSD